MVDAARKSSLCLYSFEYKTQVAPTGLEQGWNISFYYQVAPTGLLVFDPIMRRTVKKTLANSLSISVLSCCSQGAPKGLELIILRKAGCKITVLAIRIP